MKDKCLNKKKISCIDCPLLKECKVKFGEWRGYYYGLDNMKVIMLEDLDWFIKNEIKLIPPMPKKRE